MAAVSTVAPIRWCPRKPWDTETFASALRVSIERNHFTNSGPTQERLADEARVRIAVPESHSVHCAANGTAALHALISAYAMMRHHPIRVCTQAFTFPSSCDGPLCESLVVDVDDEHHGPNIAELERRKDEYDAVCVTNCMGFVVHMDAYVSVCKKLGKLLFQDNAASPLLFGKDGKCISALGDGAIISLHETKPLGRGEGGLIVVPNHVASFVDRAMNFGFSPDLRAHSKYASNYRLSDISAAAVLMHWAMCFDITKSTHTNRLLELLHLWKQPESWVHKHGTELLYGAHKHIRQRAPFITSTVPFLFKSKAHADAVFAALAELHVEVKKYYTPLIPRNEAPIAHEWFDRIVCIPFHIGMTDDEWRRLAISPECAISAALRQV